MKIEADDLHTAGNYEFATFWIAEPLNDETREYFLATIEELIGSGWSINNETENMVLVQRDWDSGNYERD